MRVNCVCTQQPANLRSPVGFASYARVRLRQHEDWGETNCPTASNGAVHNFRANLAQAEQIPSLRANPPRPAPQASGRRKTTFESYSHLLRTAVGLRRICSARSGVSHGHLLPIAARLTGLPPLQIFPVPIDFSKRTKLPERVGCTGAKLDRACPPISAAANRNASILIIGIHPQSFTIRNLRVPDRYHAALPRNFAR